MNVLMITPEVDMRHDSRGFIHGWVTKLAQRCDTLNVLTLRVGETRLPDNVHIYEFGHHGNRLSIPFRFYRALGRVSGLKSVDVVFAHMIPYFAILAAPFAKLTRKPLVLWYTHGHVSQTQKVAHFLVDRVVTATPESFRIKNKKVLVTGHGVDTDMFCPAEAMEQRESGKEKHILSVGRISPSKKHETPIRAIEVLVHEMGIQNIRLDIVGGPFGQGSEDERYFSQLRSTVTNLNLDGYVRFAGPVPYTEMVEQYRRCDVFVSASTTGSLDKVDLEAMACGVPVVTSNEAMYGVLGEYAKQLTFPSGDFRECADKLEGVLALDSDKQGEMGKTLRGIVVQNHNIDRLMDNLLGIFEGGIQR